VAAIAAGLPFGVVGVAAASALVGIFARTPVAFWLATRRGPVKLGDLYGAIAPAAAAAIAAYAAVWALRRGVLADMPSAIEGLVLCGLAGLCVIALTLLALPDSRRSLLELRHLPQRLR
jgi:PST family polysaccharide transporter